MNKVKLLVFHPALAPYRIDFFNSLNENFDACFYFFNNNLLNQKFNQTEIKEKINFDCNYIKQGFNFQGRSIRFGIFSIIKREKPDIVICPEFNLVNIFVAFSGFILKRDIKIYTICDDNIVISQNCSAIRKIIRAAVMRFLDGIILTNKSVADWYSETWNINIIIFPIIRRERLFFNELSKSVSKANEYIMKYDLKNKKVFLFVGRLAKEKNLERLIDAFRIVINSHKEARLLIVGSGYLEQKLADIVDQHHLDKSIIFTGRLEGQELLACYLVSGVLILPSISETFGAVTNEALLSGCYVLASRFAGSSILIHEGFNGMLIDPFDVKGIAHSMIECANNESIFSDQGKIRKSRMLVNYDDLINSCIKSLN